MIRWVPVLMLLVVALPAAANDWVVDARIWIDGELSGTPRLVVMADTPASIEVDKGDVAWRMNFVVEPPKADEGAASDAIWVRVGISERVGEEWIFLTDSMLGVRRGATGNFSVVDPEVEIATPRNARLFVEMTVNEAPADDPGQD
jgi:hypothetical protein